MTNNKRPDGCHYYAESADGKFRFTAWNPPPPPGDDLCRALTGRSEAQLVRDILEGRYDLEEIKT